MAFSEDRWIPVIWYGDDKWTALYIPLKDRGESDTILNHHRAQTRDANQFKWRTVKATTTYTVEDE